MIFLLLFALLSLFLAAIAIIRYPRPEAGIFSRVVLVAWFAGTIALIALICHLLWAEAHAQGTHIVHMPHVGA
jgi:hypothetical protein